MGSFIIAGGTNALFGDGQECPSYEVLCASMKNAGCALSVATLPPASRHGARQVSGFVARLGVEMLGRLVRP